MPCLTHPEYEEDEEYDYALLSFDTESAWSSCDLLFEEVNKALGSELSINWREIEPGCNIYYVHDESDFFPEECYVTAYRNICERWTMLLSNWALISQQLAIKFGDRYEIM